MTDKSIAAPTLKPGSWTFAQSLGLIPALRSAKAALTGEIRRWVRSGCPSPAPGAVKIAIVRSYVVDSGAHSFVETGTYLGNTVEVIARTGAQCHTIEIDPAVHARAKRTHARYTNIDFILGDSGVELAKLIPTLTEPTVFWLDGHYSGGVTGRGELDSPISAELDAVLAHPIKRHVILIDDAREFDGRNGYPHLSALLAQFDGHPDYRAEVSCDIIRITPRDAQR